jgi:heme exporter protein C
VIARLLLFLWIAVWTVISLTWAPLVHDLGVTTRVLYFHIPSAWISVLALACRWGIAWRICAGGGSSTTTRRRRRPSWAWCFASARRSRARCGPRRCGARTGTGIRETSIFYLLLVYGAYLALRGSIDGDERRARLSAIYSAVAFVTVPFLMFIVPRLYFTLHPDPLINTSGKIEMDPRIRVCFYAMLIGFTGLFAWMQGLRVRVLRLARRFEAAAAEPARRAV